MDNRKGHSWVVWNLANIISSSRFSTPFILFLTAWTMEEKLISYFILFFTDALDGPVARLVGNNKGAGKIIDTAADKVMHGSGLIFLLNEKLIEMIIPATVLLGEVLIIIPIIYGVYLLIKREIMEHGIRSVRKIYEVVFSELQEIMSVNAYGKSKMIAYAAAAGFIFLNMIRPTDLFRYGYILMFIAGIIFCIGAIGDYYKKYLEWQSSFFGN